MKENLKEEEVIYFVKSFLETKKMRTEKWPIEFRDMDRDLDESSFGGLVREVKQTGVKWELKSICHIDYYQIYWVLMLKRIEK